MRKALIAGIVVVVGVLWPAKAFATVAIEQQINLLNQVATTSDTTDGPPDNSLGLVSFDPAKYSNETVYFEAVLQCTGCSGGNAQASVSLYTEGGSAIATVTTAASSYTRVRSSSIGPAAANYTIRTKLDATSGTVSVKAARLIVLQSAAALTDTQTHLEMGNAESFSVSTSAVALTNKKLWQYRSRSFSSVTAAKFSATIWGAANDYVESACLYTVGGSEVGCVNAQTTTPVYPTPVSVTLVDGTTYEVRLKTDSAGTQTVSVANAELILDQSQSAGLVRFETYHQLINTLSTNNTSSYISQNTLNQFDPGTISGGDTTFFYEATLKTSAGTGTANLYNASDTTAITGSELNTTSTTYELQRSADLSGNLPGSARNMDAQIKNAATDTTSVTSSRLISRLIVDPSFTFTIAAVGANTVNNGITTSVESTITTLPFGNITPGVPRYAAHKLSVTTNTDAGYSVYAKLVNTIQGNYPANAIDPFAAEGVSWSNPVVWQTPTGTLKNVNSGWFGANTTDTRVTGWGSAAQKFGPIETVSHPVMQSTNPDSGTTAYVTYVFGVNVLQPADLYSGSLIYTVLPTY